MYELFDDMSAPSSKTKSKAEIENQETHYWNVYQWVAFAVIFSEQGKKVQLHLKE